MRATAPRRFRRRRVVDGVSLSISPGEIVGLLGPNGAGKTTSFHLILGLIPPNAGSVALDDHDITTLPMYMRARRRHRLSARRKPRSSVRMTVEENLLSILEMRRITADEDGRAPTSCSTSSVWARLRVRRATRCRAASVVARRSRARWPASRAT